MRDVTCTVHIIGAEKPEQTAEIPGDGVLRASLLRHYYIGYSTLGGVQLPDQPSTSSDICLSVNTKTSDILLLLYIGMGTTMTNSLPSRGTLS